MKFMKYNLFEKLFEKTQGMSLQHVICTTFTLSTAILPDLLLEAIALQNDLQIEKIGYEEKLLLLSKYGEEIAKKITVFSDDYLYSAINLPKSLQRVVDGYYLPNMVCRIAPKEAGVYFHPKLLIVHLKDEKNKDIIRVAVLSKNLTHGEVMTEIGCMFETSENAYLMEEQTGEKLYDFFDMLTLGDSLEELLKKEENLNGKTLPRSTTAERIKATKCALKTMKFRLICPDGAKVPEKAEIRFGYPGNPLLPAFEKDMEEIKTEKSAFYWCSDSISKKFIENYGCKYMVSNLRSWWKILQNKETGKVEEVPEYAFWVKKTSLQEAQPIHAKFFEGDGREKHIVWIGSANFTENAFRNNYECDVRMEFSKGEKMLNYIMDNEKKLMPPPLERDGENSIQTKQVNLYDLIPIKAEQEFISRIQRMDWCCEIDEETMLIKTTKAENFEDADEVVKKEMSKWLLGISLFLPNLRRDLEIQMDKDRNVTFFIKCSPYTSQMVPWYGYANVVFFKSYNSPVIIPIKIRLIHKEKLPLRQYIMEQEEVKGALLSGRAFSMRSVIPPEPRSSMAIYESSDTFEIRLAKYLIKASAIYTQEKTYQEIYRNIDMLVTKMQIQEDDVDNEEYEDCSYVSLDELDLLKQRLEKLKEFLIEGQREEQWSN